MKTRRGGGRRGWRGSSEWREHRSSSRIGRKVPSTSAIIISCLLIYYLESPSQLLFSFAPSCQIQEEGFFFFFKLLSIWVQWRQPIIVIIALENALRLTWGLTQSKRLKGRLTDDLWPSSNAKISQIRAGWDISGCLMWPTSSHLRLPSAIYGI